MADLISLSPHEATSAGLTRRQLEGPGFVRVRRGLYVPAGTSLDDVDTRVALVARSLPDGYVLGGWAAARIHERSVAPPDDLVVFDGRLPEMEQSARVRLPVLVCASRPRRLRGAPDIRLFRSDLDPADVATVDGVAVTSPVRTAFDLARLWTTTPAVVALDRFRALGLVTAEQVAAAIERRKGWVGVARAREALALSDDGVESPRESMMRLLWLEAGLPQPVCNAEICDQRGRFVARVDLLDEAAGLVAEYDGAEHADAQRRWSDALRQERLEELGLVVVRANDPDVSSAAGRAQWRARVRAARVRASAWERPQSWTAGVRRRARRRATA